MKPVVEVTAFAETERKDRTKRKMNSFNIEIERERNNNRCLIISIIMFFVGFPVQHCAEPRTQLKRLKDAHRQKERELKVTRVEMEKAKVITKVFKSLMVDENNQLRTEISELKKKIARINHQGKCERGQDDSFATVSGTSSKNHTEKRERDSVQGVIQPPLKKRPN